MKILIVVTKSEIGGVQVFVLNLARALKEIGYNVEVAAGEGNYLSNELTKETIPFHYLDSLKRNASIFASFYFIYDLHKLLKKNNYDLLHLNSSNALLGTLSRKFLQRQPKIVFTFHGLSVVDKNYETHPLNKLISKLYFKIFLKTPDRNVFVSRINYRESMENGIVKSADVIYNGLDEARMHFLNREESRQYLSKKFNYDLSGKFLIGSIGRLAYQKNYDFLIQHYSKIKNEIQDAKIVIIGDGPYAERFSREVKEMGIEKDLFFTGAVENSYQYLKAFDLFTLPSHHEGLPISLIEALIAGLPILASDVGGNREIVNNSPEQLFRLNDIDDYLNKLREIVKNLERISGYNLSLKNNFTLDKMVKEYKSIYDSLFK